MAVSWRQRHTSDGLRGWADALHRMIPGGVGPLGGGLGGLLLVVPVFTGCGTDAERVPETATGEGRP